MDAPVEPGLLGPRELAAYLRVAPATLRRLRAAGEVPPPRMLAGRIPRWRRADLDAWLAAQPEAAQS